MNGTRFTVLFQDFYLPTVLSNVLARQQKMAKCIQFKYTQKQYATQGYPAEVFIIVAINIALYNPKYSQKHHTD